MSFGREEEPHHRRRRPAGRRSTRRKSPLKLLLLLILLIALLTLLAIIALIASRSFGNTVSGKVPAEDSVVSGPNPTLRISNERGPVRVEGVERLESIELEATKYALGPDREEARRRASEVSTELSESGGSTFVVETGGGRATGVDYTLRAPQGSSIELESEAGDVEIANLDGDVSVRTGAGDVQVKDTRGSVEVRALQGDVEVSDVSTDTGQVDVDIGTGDAVMRDLVVGTLDLRVETGDAVLSGRFSGGGQALVQTGDLVVRLPTEDTRDITFETGVGDVVRKAGGPGEE